MAEIRCFITKSRAGHYSVTARRGGEAVTIGKLPSLGAARAERATAEAALARQIAQHHQARDA